MSELSFEQIVETFYEGLYRFAFSLCRSESEASDLTQQTFLIWAKKGEQLRDKSKVKTWLFTTLYREFLGFKRKYSRMNFMESETLESELNAVEPDSIRKLDAGVVMDSLAQLEDTYRVPLALFYLDQHSYKEIATILDVPIGTVMSRLSRAKSQLRQLLQNPRNPASDNIINFGSVTPNPAASGNE